MLHLQVWNIYSNCLKKNVLNSLSINLSDCRGFFYSNTLLCIKISVKFQCNDWGKMKTNTMKICLNSDGKIYFFFPITCRTLSSRHLIWLPFITILICWTVKWPKKKVTTAFLTLLQVNHITNNTNCCACKLLTQKNYFLKNLSNVITHCVLRGHPHMISDFWVGR